MPKVKRCLFTGPVNFHACKRNLLYSVNWVFSPLRIQLRGEGASGLRRRPPLSQSQWAPFQNPHWEHLTIPVKPIATPCEEFETAASTRGLTGWLSGLVGRWAVSHPYLERMLDMAHDT